MVIGLAILLATATSAQAVTVKDIVDLTRAGLGDDVLLALIEVDGGVFNVDTQTLTQLKAAGVSEKVIVALVRSGRTPPPAPPPQPDLINPESAPPPPPQVVYVEPPAPVVREVAIPVPVYVAVPVASRGRHAIVQHGTEATIEPSITTPQLHPSTKYETDRPAPAKPEYWGWGGKQRPDSWKN
jgi:hypothetical protein